MNKQNKIIPCLVLLLIPSIISLLIIGFFEYYIIALEVFVIMVYFILILYFSNDLFSPFIFFFINIFLGAMDIVFVCLKIRNVAIYYPVQIYEKTLFLVIIWLITFFIGYKFKNKLVKKNSDNINNENVQKEYKNGNKRLSNSLLIVSFIVTMFLATKVLLTIKEVGTLSMRLSFFEGQGYILAMFPICGFMPILLMEKGYKKIAIFADVIVFVIIALSGRRMVAIITSIFPLLLYYNYKVKKIKIKKLFILAIPITIFILIVGYIRTNTNNIIGGEKNAFVNVMVTMGKYVQYGENVPDLIYNMDNGNIKFQYFSYALRGIEGLIPRSLWKDKPAVDYSNITSIMIYGYDKGYGQPVGQFGWAYFCFGYIGVIVSGLITGYISCMFYKWSRKENTATSIGIYALMIIQIINIFTPDSQMKIIFFSLYIVIAKIFSQVGQRKIYKEQIEKTY